MNSQESLTGSVMWASQDSQFPTQACLVGGNSILPVLGEGLTRPPSKKELDILPYFQTRHLEL